jgi:uncharacterized protein YjbJ (UPF0337 family)
MSGRDRRKPGAAVSAGTDDAEVRKAKGAAQQAIGKLIGDDDARARADARLSRGKAASSDASGDGTSSRG